MTGIVPPGQGHLLTARGNEMAFKAVAEQTGGDFSLMERTVPPGARTPPPHRHVTCSEAFFVLAGTVTFRLDDAELTGGAGDFLLVPRGAAHTFGNGGSEPARLLVLHAPAMDAYFEELHKLWSAGQPPSRETELELMSRYGMEPAAVEEGAVHAGCPGDAGHADFLAVRRGPVEGSGHTLAAACGVGLPAGEHRRGRVSRRGGVLLGACGHGVSFSAGATGAAGRVPGMPRWIARCRRRTVIASSIAVFSVSPSSAMSPLIRLMSRRMRVISSCAGVASARAQSSTPSMAAARRSRLRSRSSR